MAPSAGGGLQWEAGEFPFEDAVGGALGGDAVLVEEADGVVGEDAVAASSVGDDLAVGGEFGQALGQLVEGDVERSGEVSGGVFGVGAHVENHGVAGLDAAQEFVAGDGGGVLGAEVGAAGDLGVGAVVVGDPAEHLGQ